MRKLILLGTAFLALTASNVVSADDKATVTTKVTVVGTCAFKTNDAMIDLGKVESGSGKTAGKAPVDYGCTIGTPYQLVAERRSVSGTTELLGANDGQKLPYEISLSGTPKGDGVEVQTSVPAEAGARVVISEVNDHKGEAKQATAVATVPSFAGIRPDDYSGVVDLTLIVKGKAVKK